MNEIIRTYYAQNAKKLHGMVDGILMKYGNIPESDKEDFYSLANEVFVMVMEKYDFSQSFDVFLFACLSNRIKTELTRRNRQKRKADRLSISIDMPIGENDSLTIADLLPSDFDMQSAVLENMKENYSEKMLMYLSRLSIMQREILEFSILGYSPGEIQHILQISKKEYAECDRVIHAYRNISLLF